LGKSSLSVEVSASSGFWVEWHSPAALEVSDFSGVLFSVVDILLFFLCFSLISCWGFPFSGLM